MKIKGLLKRIYLLPINILSYSQKAHLKENIKIIKKLDYQKKDILMTIDSSMQIRRLNACKKEPETVEWIETFFNEGDVFYDIGANVGAYSFVAHAVMNGLCKVFAFEPSFSTFDSLCKNIILNKCTDEIFPLQIALSNNTEIKRFHYHDIAPGSSMHLLHDNEYIKNNNQGNEITQPVISFRLDDLIDLFNLDAPNLIKLDVDGTELDVLYGAKKVLSNKNLRSIIIEVDEEQYPNQEIPRYLSERGLEIISRNPRGESERYFTYIFQRRNEK